MAHLSWSTIPVRILIGVSTHYKLDFSPEAVEQVRIATHSIIDEINHMLPHLSNAPLVFSVLLTLADEADGLITREILNECPQSTLEVVVPSNKDKQVNDFLTFKSNAICEKLISQAERIVQIPTEQGESEVCREIDKYIVDNCDVLITVWDGNTSDVRGDNAVLVQYALESKCPVFWLHAANLGKVTVELGRGLNTQSFQDLDEFNSERVDESKLNRQIEYHRSVLDDILVDTLMDTETPTNTRSLPALEYILRFSVRTDLLALHCQRLHHVSEMVIYILAALAIAVATIQALFFPEKPIILLFEILFIMLVLGIFWLGHKRRWHAKWMDYRFLAERFRSALFIELAGLDVASLRPPRHLSLAYSTRDWMVLAFSLVWSRRPRYRGLRFSWQEVRNVLCSAWIDNQINYHTRNSQRLNQRHHHLALTSNVLFLIAFCAALYHIIAHAVGANLSWLPNYVSLIAIVFPALAGSISAVRTHRDYRMNSMRSDEMARHLIELRDRFAKVSDKDSFLSLVKEVEETMLLENQDWRVVVRFPLPEMPA